MELHSITRSRKLGGRRSAWLLAGALIVAGVLVACSESTSEPSSAVAARPSFATSPATSTTNSTTSVKTLTWGKPATAHTVSALIGPRGGNLSIPAGMQLIVPAGAVATPVRFSVTRLAGSIVAYDFEPHGLVFLKPVEIDQPTLGTNFFRWTPTRDIQGAYFLGLDALDQSTGTALAAEFEPTLVSADKAWIKFQVGHFSGYMISTGRDER